MKKSFTCELQGGLGNQLFQLAAANYVSLRTGRTPKIATSRIEAGPVKREFALPDVAFRLLAPQAVISKDYIPLVFKRLFWKYGSFTPLSYLHYKQTQTNCGYDPLLESEFEFSRLSGYFQTYKYVEALPWREQIAKMELISPALAYWLRESELSSPTALHIRGGDYLLDKSGIGNLSPLFFESVLFEVVPPKSVVWVFTDDQSHARNIIADLPYRFLIVDEKKLLTPFETLILMASAQKIMISNSTFAWWCAYFSRSSEIYAPSKWFQNLPDPLHLIPSNWNRITSDWL